MVLAELLGWYGAIAIIGAYYLNSTGRLSAQSRLYQLLNITGALGIVIVSFAKSAWQPAALNCIWALIALVSLLQLRRAR